jgi:hypothetical protein
MSLKSTGAGDASTGFYPHTIGQSLRFNNNDAPYLSRTHTTGNRQTFTLSVWFKRSDIFSSGSKYFLHTSTSGSAAGAYLYITTAGVLTYYDTSTTICSTSNLFREGTAWYNIVFAVDFTQSTGSNRVKIYVNGTQQTVSFTDDKSTSFNSYFNSNIVHYISTTPAANAMDGYLAEMNFIDGQQLDPSSFGETKAGIWVPIDTSGLTFGTNGFRLTFEGTGTSTTSAGTTAQTNIGDDQSGGGHNWAVTNLASTDVVKDSPTNNFATMNSLDKNSPNMQEGDLKVYGDTSFSVFEGAKGTFLMSSGKWYWEVYIDVGGFTQTGITPTSATAVKTTTNLSYHTDAMTYESNGNKSIGTGGVSVTPSGRTSSSYGASYTDGDIIGVALDLDSSTTTLTFYKNNSTQGAAFSSLANDEYVPLHTGIQNNFGIFNFGQDSSFAGTKTAQGNTDSNGQGDFYYTPPSGYLACCTANLPDPGIDPAQDEEPADYFNTVLYTGTGSTRSVTGVGFQPDFVWIKDRTTAYDHHLFDVVRGGGNSLYSNDTVVENTYPTDITFASDGFSIADGSAYPQIYLNKSSDAFVSWNWLAGGSASSNSNGSITSSVSANTEAGFSIVTYTGNATAGATVGHGLSSTLEMYIVKSRSLATSWVTYHKDAATSPEDGYLVLNGTDTFFDTVVWNDTAPTNSVFSLGGTGYSSNNSGATYVAYCFHSVDGYSKVGSYTGNGSTNGPFVHLGFRPAWVIIKRTDSSADWIMFDNKRDTENELTQFLYPNLSNSEATGSGVLDFVSNGFVLRNGGTSNRNAQNGSYIYLAFAEQPFKYSNAR